MTYEKLYYVLDNIEVDSNDKDLVEALSGVRMALLSAIKEKAEMPTEELCIKVYDVTGVCDCSECKRESRRISKPMSTNFDKVKEFCTKIKEAIYGK